MYNCFHTKMYNIISSCLSKKGLNLCNLTFRILQERQKTVLQENGLCYGSIDFKSPILWYHHFKMFFSPESQFFNMRPFDFANCGTVSIISTGPF